MARRAKAFGLNVIAYDPYVSELEITGAGVEPVGFGELLQRSDYLSIHTPHNDETEHAFSTDAFSKMKETAVVINTARGPIIDEGALINALQQGEIAGAGLDVLEQEPPANDNPLLNMENVVVTHTLPRRPRVCDQKPDDAWGARWLWYCVENGQ